MHNCIDYADLMMPPMGMGKDIRDRINWLWIALRALSSSGSQPLVLTATQANRESMKTGTISMTHTSEDIRKVAHVTGLIGLNQMNDEKQQQLMRINWVALREDANDSNKCCQVAGCFAIGNPAMCSLF